MSCDEKPPSPDEQPPGKNARCQPQPRRFRTTRWSLVVRARSGDIGSGEARRAFDELCRLYWYPVYAFMRQSRPPEDAADLTQQLGVVAASVMAGMGIAGIPEAGIVLLPTVLSAAGLPIEIAMAAVPLVMPVDWILARARTAMNVLSDILVAILLDRECPAAAPASEAERPTTVSPLATAELGALDVLR